MKKKFFALGLIFLVLAQILFSVHSESINLLEPIDFIHWILLVGTALITPFTLVFSKGWYHKVGATISFLSIISMIGMCAIDLVLWAFRNDMDGRSLVFQGLKSEPSIWLIFITIGPALLFPGLTIQALGYVKDNFWGVITTIIGSVLTGIGHLIFSEYRIIFILGYVLFACGLLVITFDKSANIEKH